MLQGSEKSASMSNGAKAHRGEGTTFSSDGHRHRAGGRGERGPNKRALWERPECHFYTHISDCFARFHPKVINAMCAMRRTQNSGQTFARINLRRSSAA